MVLIDSSAWIAFWRPVDTPLGRAVDRVLDRSVAIVGDLVLAEVLQGLRPSEVELVTDVMSGFNFEPLGGREIAVKAAANYRLMRQRGITVRGTIDVIIATWCIENGVPILHNDRDMAAMEEHLGLVAYA
ncbi:type II toxin-antitoxin system VapC family toxin [Aureimonas mangrovi]|uniref:type II toxin-antitoxin system VapC family toxin n=1 Tax=Aureimonas mangrovi TaxID=2758041 RepID=UPI00163D6852|nr:PIN domain nuclease [Aureimonas mangrovi]